MIPLRDTIPSKTTPIITVSLIILNLIIYIYEVSLGEQLNGFIQKFGMVPSRFLTVIQEKPYDLSGWFVPMISSIFLHGSWLHVIGNMWYLWIFGDNIEDRLGHGRFVFFYILCGVLADLSHVFINSQSNIPTVGASGAIAGVMGAYFILYPKSRVLTLIPIFIFIEIIEIPAVIFLGFWIFMQFIYGTAALSGQTGGVAWWAHFGGFLFGVILAILLRIGKRRR